MDWSKNGVLEGAFCRRRLNYVFPRLSPLLLTLFSPLPPSEAVNSTGSIGRSRRKGGMAANSGVRVGWLVGGESSGFRPNNATRGHGT